MGTTKRNEAKDGPVFVWYRGVKQSHLEAHLVRIVERAVDVGAGGDILLYRAAEVALVRACTRGIPHWFADGQRRFRPERVQVDNDEKDVALRAL